MFQETLDLQVELIYIYRERERDSVDEKEKKEGGTCLELHQYKHQQTVKHSPVRFFFECTRLFYLSTYTIGQTAGGGSFF